MIPQQPSWASCPSTKPAFQLWPYSWITCPSGNSYHSQPSGHSNELVWHLARLFRKTINQFRCFTYYWRPLEFNLLSTWYSGLYVQNWYLWVIFSILLHFKMQQFILLCNCWTMDRLSNLKQRNLFTMSSLPPSLIKLIWPILMHTMRTNNWTKHSHSQLYGVSS